MSDREVLLAGLRFFQPQPGKLGGQKIATKSDVVRSLLGDGEEQETFDGHPLPDDGRNVLPTWRTLAVDARGLDRQAIGHCSNEACQATHRAELRRQWT